MSLSYPEVPPHPYRQGLCLCHWPRKFIHCGISGFFRSFVRFFSGSGPGWARGVRSLRIEIWFRVEDPRPSSRVHEILPGKIHSASHACLTPKSPAWGGMVPDMVTDTWDPDMTPRALVPMSL